MSTPPGRTPVHHPNCFGCSTTNPHSLRLDMRAGDDRSITGTITFDHHHEGGPGLAHGGAVAAAFDDLLGAVPGAHELPAVTASLSVDFKAPVLLGEELRLHAALRSREGRKLQIKGDMRRSDGTMLATSKALFLVVDLDHFRQAGHPVPDEWAAWPAIAPAVAP